MQLKNFPEKWTLGEGATCSYPGYSPAVGQPWYSGGLRRRRRTFKVVVC
jgi:hypothetical protein